MLRGWGGSLIWGIKGLLVGKLVGEFSLGINDMFRRIYFVEWRKVEVSKSNLSCTRRYLCYGGTPAGTAYFDDLGSGYKERMR